MICVFQIAHTKTGTVSAEFPQLIIQKMLIVSMNMKEKEKNMTEKQIVKYDVTEAKISEMRNLYMDLTVSDLKDQEGFEAVESGRKVIKGYRVATEKQRKVFKSDALEYGRMVDSKAKEIFSLLEPIETHLVKEGDKIRDEEKRIEAEKEAAEKKKIQGRVDALLRVGVTMDYFDVASLSDDDFENTRQIAEAEWAAEQVRLDEERRIQEEAVEAERKEREAEIQRLADEKERLEKWDKEQKEKEEKLRAEQREIQQRQQETEKALQEQRRKLEAEKKAEDERLDKEHRELADQKTKARTSALYNIGLKFDGEQFFYQDINVHITEFSIMPNAEFSALVAELEPKVKERKKEKANQEAKDKAALEKRLTEEAEARAQKEAQDEADRLAQEKIEAEAEAERLEALKPDKEKLREFSNMIYVLAGDNLILESDEARKLYLSILEEITHTADSLIHAIGRL